MTISEYFKHGRFMLYKTRNGLTSLLVTDFPTILEFRQYMYNRPETMQWYREYKQAVIDKKIAHNTMRNSHKPFRKTFYKLRCIAYYPTKQHEPRPYDGIIGEVITTRSKERAMFLTANKEQLPIMEELHKRIDLEGWWRA